MHFKILFVFAFILHIYLHFCKATNLYHLFSIVFYWTKATFIVYLKNYLYIYASIHTHTAYEQMLSQYCWFFIKALLCAIILLQVTSSAMGNRLFFFCFIFEYICSGFLCFSMKLETTQAIKIIVLRHLSY